MSPILTDDDATTWWRVILTDWYNCRAKVTLTIRSGAQFTGEINKRPGISSDTIALRTVEASGRETRHDVLLSEVVAITAESS